MTVLKRNHDPLESVKKNNPPTEFVWYNEFGDTLGSQAKIIAILADGQLVDTVPENQTVQIVLDKTCCYTDKSGQVGDTGFIEKPILRLEPCFKVDCTFTITSTQIDGELIVHFGYISYVRDGVSAGNAKLKTGDNVYVSVNENHRRAIKKAIQRSKALREALGRYAEQQGSKVSQDKSRFCFTSYSSLEK
jgi:alanyl-tRNA synthetase